MGTQGQEEAEQKKENPKNISALKLRFICFTTPEGRRGKIALPPDNRKNYKMIKRYGRTSAQGRERERGGADKDAEVLALRKQRDADALAMLLVEGEAGGREGAS